ncbi:glycoside hydrolase family 30 protein [Vallitalea guaymasensis]|uniref:glycoside hydrolase family 30 protein n=1 Tax=Vallitalea guaymasensis TaxID=1185412 RepID=UPI00272D6041|nr:glycoside hydrolase [Vallitalea guaymasensis]
MLLFNRKNKIFFTFMLITFLLFANASKVTYANEDNVIVIDPFGERQTFEGWGTTLCWWANIIGGWSEENVDKVMDLLYSPTEGLGFTVARYNIGGGDNPTHSHMRIGGDVPGYLPIEGGSYDWTKDANQRKILDEAIERGADILEAFSNSPPYWMTYSGCSAGNTFPWDDNLKEDYFDDFADYLTEVVKHFRDEWGITFRTLSPINEPSTGLGWKAFNNQEGCDWSKESQEKIYRELYNSLVQKGLINQIKISGNEETNLDWTLNMEDYSQDVIDSIWQINTHSYHGTKRPEVKSLARFMNKKIWMSETDSSPTLPLSGGAHDHHGEHAIEEAMWLAEKIYYDVYDIGAEAWVFWQAVEDETGAVEGDHSFGLIHTPFNQDNDNYILTKKYYTMAQYSKFIRPGYKIIYNGVSKTLAAYGENDNKLVLVAYNDTNNSKTYRYDLSRFDTLGDTQAYRTSINEDLQQIENFAINEDILEISLPAKSVTTMVVDADYHNNDNIMYYVDCGNVEHSNSFSNIESNNNLRNSVPDQAYGIDTISNYSWGYETDGGTTVVPHIDDMFFSIRTDESLLGGRGITYKFEVPNGFYNIDLGFRDPWSHSYRKMDITIEGDLKTWRYVPPRWEEIKSYKGIEVNDGILTIEIDRCKHIIDNNADAMISFIRVDRCTE